MESGATSIKLEPSPVGGPDQRIERPIAFVSKSLTKTQARWSVGEKEAWAIVFVLRQLRHILRDVPFTLETDHRNLTFLKESRSEKITRWRMEMQEYVFTLRHVKGAENTVADVLSRLCKSELEAPPQRQQQPTWTKPAALNLIQMEERLADDVHEKIAAVHNAECGHLGVRRSLLAQALCLMQSRN